MYSVNLGFVILFTIYFFFKGYGDHRDLHVLTHSFPTRRSSDLSRPRRKSRPRFSPQSDTCAQRTARRSEEHTSELQSHRRISYAVFCLKKKRGPDKWPRGRQRRFCIRTRSCQRPDFHTTFGIFFF